MEGLMWVMGFIFGVGVSLIVWAVSYFVRMARDQRQAVQKED